MNSKQKPEFADSEVEINLVTSEPYSSFSTAQHVESSAPANTTINCSATINESSLPSQPEETKQEIASPANEQSRIHPKPSRVHRYLIGWIVFVIFSIFTSAAHGLLINNPVMPVSSLVFLGFLFLPALLFLPMIVAGFRKSSKSNQVTLLSTVLGWTGVGWLTALWIAFKSPTDSQHKLTSAYRNSMIGLAFLTLISIIAFIPGLTFLQPLSVLAINFEPVQAILAFLSEKRLKEKNSGRASMGPLPAWLGATISSSIVSAVMIGAIAEFLGALISATDNLLSNHAAYLLLVAFSTWLVPAMLLLMMANIMLFYFRLAKDFADSASKRTIGIPYRALFTGLGPGLSMLWIALNTGGTHWFEYFGFAIAMGQLWSMTFMYFTVRDWEQNANGLDDV